jgi:uncharacterized protein YkwD
MRVSAMAGVVILLAGCTVPIGVPTGAGSGGAAPPSGSSLTALEREVVAEVNRTRQGNGRARLVEDAVLARAARGHAEELASRRTLTHTSTDPARRTMTMRIEAAGGTWTRAAENLASMSGSASNVPAQTVRVWMGSDGHRRNLLEADYTHTGVGIAVDSRGVWYVTQIYVRSR